MLQVDIVSRKGEVWSGESKSVVFPSLEGDVGILPGHTPMMALLREGNVSVKAVDGEQKFHVTDGFVTVDQDRVYVVSEL
ncbi:MAG: F0F1 ATP synthase subunit epsilon [Actinomycetaceae bacterium]|nr:F0F1 ATP synthase subunit epsilon [Actinomycetaceae bacterium]